MIFYYHIIFTEIPFALLYRHASFYGHFDPFKLKVAYVATALYIVLFLLNVMWYYKIVRGAAKALGLLGTPSAPKVK